MLPSAIQIIIGSDLQHARDVSNSGDNGYDYVTRADRVATDFVLKRK